MVGIKKLWYKMTVNEVLGFFVTDSNNGLSTDDVAARSGKFGYNKPTFINESVQKHFTYKTIRSGNIVSIQSNKLVLGDIIMLKAGDIAPADLRLVKVDKFSVNEESLTGSPGHTNKNTFLAKSLLPKSKQTNMVFGGSVITSGAAYGVVVSYVQSKNSKIRKNLLAKQLSKNNIYTNKSISQEFLKNIDTIVFDDLRRDYEVIKSFQKIYLEKNITCIYFLEPMTLNRLKFSTPEAKTIKAHELDSEITGVVFVEKPTSVQKTKILSKLSQAKRNVLYVYRGERYETAASIADISLVTTDMPSQESIVKATLITDGLNINNLGSILYNKK